ncbi:MAG: alpha/beta hydrolase fold domain-containing protein [Saccharofermentanales bacterium]
MASIQSRLLEKAMRLLNTKKYFTKPFEDGRSNGGQSKGPPRLLYSKVKWRKTRFLKRNIFTIRPDSGRTKKHILFLHGGGYINGFHLTHWLFIHTLVSEAHCTVVAPDYPLAPKATYKDTFAMVIPIYIKLAKKVGSKNLILMGDSAGGGFALALAQKMKELNMPQPDQIILLSPWLDVTLENKEVIIEDENDPMLCISGLQEIGQAYAGNADPHHYMISPINGPVEGLGKISIFIGTKEILAADARKFKDMALSEGVVIDYYEYQDMIHDWVLYELPESRQAKDQIIELILK